jgi:hypothetical protein
VSTWCKPQSTLFTVSSQRCASLWSGPCDWYVSLKIGDPTSAQQGLFFEVQCTLLHDLKLVKLRCKRGHFIGRLW